MEKSVNFGDNLGNLAIDSLIGKKAEPGCKPIGKASRRKHGTHFRR